MPLASSAAAARESPARPGPHLRRRGGQRAQRVRGQATSTVRLALCCLMAEGHLLVEDHPGVGKTTLAKALARSLDLTFGRVQFTADLLPSDVTGAMVFDRDTGHDHLPARARVHQHPPGRRAQPGLAQGAVGAAGVDGGAPGQRGRRQPRPAPAVHGHRHPEPLRRGRDLPAPPQPARPVPAPAQPRLPRPRRRGRAARLHADPALPRLAAGRGRAPRSCAPSPTPWCAPTWHPRCAATSSTSSARPGRTPTSPWARRPGPPWPCCAPRGRWPSPPGRDYVTPDDVKAVAEPALGHRVVVHPAAELAGVTASSTIEEIMYAPARPRRRRPVTTMAGPGTGRRRHARARRC